MVVSEARVDKHNQQKAFLLVVVQAAVSGIISILTYLYSKEMALSLLVGGLICTLGCAGSALIAFRCSAIRPVKEVLAYLYLAEAGKFLIVAILFIVAFKSVVFLRESQNAILVFVSFMIVQSVSWVSLIASSKSSH